jgi:hypothetical protein
MHRLSVLRLIWVAPSIGKAFSAHHAKKKPVCEEKAQVPNPRISNPLPTLLSPTAGHRPPPT